MDQAHWPLARRAEHQDAHGRARLGLPGAVHPNGWPKKGDAPQAEPLIEGLPATVVGTDTAYDADHLRRKIAETGAIAVIPNNASRAQTSPG